MAAKTKPAKKNKPVATSIPAGLKGLVDTINTKFGDGSVICGQQVVNVEAIPTGIPSLDLAMGVGGLPRGRIVEIFGAESSGKTTTMLQAIAACQQRYFKEKKRHGVAGFIDAEHALDPIWAKQNGVDLDKLVLNQPSSGEEAAEVCKLMARSGAVDIIVIDSVAALVPQAELDGDEGAIVIAGQARLISALLRKVKGYANDTGTVIVFINQIRHKVGFVLGNPETTPGGLGLKFYASLRVDLRKAEVIKKSEEAIGIKTRAKIIKNKVAPPFKLAEYEIYFGKSIGGGRTAPVYGVDFVGSLIETALVLDVVGKNGSVFNYRDTKIANGLDKMVATLYSHPELTAHITEDVYAAMKNRGGDLVAASDGELASIVNGNGTKPSEDANGT